MKLMNKIAVVFISGAFVSQVQADDSASQALQQALSDIQQYHADFQQTVSDAEGEVVHEAQGSLTLARPDKLRWETVLPDESLLIADGKAVWNIDTFVEQVTIIDQSKAVKDNPIMLLTSSDDAVWAKFDVTQEGDGSQNYVVAPKSEDGQIRKLTFSFDGSKLIALSMLDAQEQTSFLTFSNIDTTSKPASSLFVAPVNENFIIDDQR